MSWLAYSFELNVRCFFFFFSLNFLVLVHRHTGRAFLRNGTFRLEKSTKKRTISFAKPSMPSAIGHRRWFTNKQKSRVFFEAIPLADICFFFSADGRFFGSRNVQRRRRRIWGHHRDESADRTAVESESLDQWRPRNETRRWILKERERERERESVLAWRQLGQLRAGRRRFSAARRSSSSRWPQFFSNGKWTTTTAKKKIKNRSRAVLWSRFAFVCFFF